MFPQVMLFITLLAFSKSEMNSFTFVHTQIVHLLQNISHCDLQIFHDGLDFGNHNIPAKVIWIPAFLNLKSSDPSGLAINIFSSRTPQHSLSLFLPKLLLEPKFVNQSEKFLRLWSWIEISVGYHLSTVLEVEFVLIYLREKIKRRFYQYGDNMFVILISNRREEELNHFVTVGSLPTLYNSYTFMMLYVAKNNRTMELCGIKKIFGGKVTMEKCKQITEWDRRVDIASKWLDTWCLGLQMWQPIKIFKPSSSEESIHPFDRNENYTMELWTLFVLSKLTIYLTWAKLCPEIYPQLGFDYKLGNEDFVTAVSGSDRFQVIVPVTPVITRNTGFQYFTCYRERYQPFGIYIAPFQPQLWLTLLITLALMIALNTIYKHFTMISCLVEYHLMKLMISILISIVSTVLNLTTRLVQWPKSCGIYFGYLSQY